MTNISVKILKIIAFGAHGASSETGNKLSDGKWIAADNKWDQCDK